MIIIDYILKAHVVFIILFLVYYTLFRKEKFLVLNRFVLVGIVAVTFILPLLPASNIKGLNINQRPHSTVVNTFPKFIVNNQPTNDQNHISEAVQVDYVTSVIAFYILVAAVLLIILFINLFKVCVVIKMSYRNKANGITYCEPWDDTAPFSFFNFIVVSKSGFSAEEYRQIITHESAHSRQLHSFDLLLADMACILLWINPFIYLYRRQLKLNLEFLADECAISSGIDARNYQLNLLQHSGILKSYLPVNAFFTSKIKERIVMINTERPSLSNSCKYLLLPTLVLLLSVFVGFKKEGAVSTDKSGLLLKSITETGKPVLNRQPFFSKSKETDKHLTYKSLMPVRKQLKSTNEGFSVTIDARTDTVKFSLVADSTGHKFKGIYVIGDKIFSDDEIRAAIKPTGMLQMVLASRPVLGMYSANHTTAVKKWGEQARPGVVFVTARPEKPNK